MEATKDSDKGERSQKPSSLRWKILRQALLHTSEKQPETGLKHVSRRTTGGFNLIPFALVDYQSGCEENSAALVQKRDVCFCYTLPIQNAPRILQYQRIDDRADLTDFQACNKHNIDNTGLVCQWPSEDVLAYCCLSHADKFWHKRVIELGAGYGLAGFVIAAATEALEVVITDGNPQVVDYIQRSINANSGVFDGSKVKSMVLHWNDDQMADIANSYDIIVASDCTFFKEFHKGLARTIRLLLRKDAPSEAILLSPKRGDSLDKFLLEVKESGMQYKVTEVYDQEVWSRHQKLITGDHSWPNYEKDHCYPILISVKL